MKVKSAVVAVVLFVAGVALGAGGAGAQEATRASEPHVPLTEQAVAFDAQGQPALAARLRTTTLAGTPEAPLSNIQFVVENRGSLFYSYVSGWVTFYDANGVRCGEGAFTVSALAPNESVETDAPGLRLRCAAASWRIAANNLVTRTEDAAKPAGAQALTTIPSLIINVNGKVLPLKLDTPLDVRVGGERVKIIVSAAP